MISQEELDAAIYRYKARQAGHEVSEPAFPSHAGQVLVAAVAFEEVAAEEVGAEEVGAEEVGAEAYQLEGSGDPVEGVPRYVASVSDSSLIELSEDAFDPESER